MRKFCWKLCFSLFFIGIFFRASAQEEDCDCAKVFDELVVKLEANYIALAQMRSSGMDAEYEQRKTKYRQDAGIITSETCTQFLQEFLSFFEDRHLFVFERPAYEEEDLMEFKRRAKATKTSEQEIQKILSSQIHESPADQIIGKWTDGKSEFAIVKNEMHYRVRVIKSTEEGIESGELKAEFAATVDGYAGTYLTYAYAPRYLEGAIYKEGTLFQLAGGISWGRLETTLH